MNVERMNRTNYINIQDARIANGKYLVKWQAHTRFGSIVVCFKSSWLSYADFTEILKQTALEKRFEEDELYWEILSRQTSYEVSIQRIRPPVEIVLLPIAGETIYIPQSEEEFDKLKKTVKGTISCNRTEKAGVFAVEEQMVFSNKYLPLSGDTIIGGYSIDGYKYPVTVDMMDEVICVKHPKKYDCTTYISEELSSMYSLQNTIS